MQSPCPVVDRDPDAIGHPQYNGFSYPFITTVGKGSRSLTYFARATTPGQFTALPAQVYAMYDLGMWGRSGMSAVEIK